MKKSAIRRFFLLCLAGLFASYDSALADEYPCPGAAYDESASVSHVHDGDTVKLEDGRKVRLIGINTPEVASDDHPAEAFALPARDLLRSLLAKHDNRVRLVHGRENHDHHQRTLAHLFLPDGTNLQAQLLSSGLASAITIPPNERFSSCYQQAEKQALCAQKGLWSEKIMNVADLDDAATGFRVLTAKLVSLQSSSKGLWLTLEQGLSLRIANQHLALFDKPKLQSLVGQSVIVRGWLQTKKNAKAGERFYMQIKHPSAIDAEKIVLKC